MTKSDFDFYNDQKGPQLGRCSNVAEKLLPSDERFGGMTDYKMLLSASTSAQNEGNINEEPMDQQLTEHFSSSDSASTQSSNDFVPAKRQKVSASAKAQNRVPLKQLARISERYGLSDRAAGTAASATMKYFGIISSDDSSFVVDRSNLRRERQTRRRKSFV